MLLKSPVVLLSAIALFTLTSTGTSRAQLNAQPPADGFTVQERGGIVLVKPQAWSKETEAVVVEFAAFTDRTASGAAGAGYIEFKTKGADKRQVPTARIVKMVVYPDPKLVKEIVTRKDRDDLDSVAKDIRTTIAKYPATRTYVEPALKKVEEEVAMYDSGKVKTGGAWVAKDAYVSERAKTFAAQLRPDILNANPPTSFDLASDPRFLALDDMAKSNASVKPIVTDLSNLHGKRVREYKRKDLLAKLASPEITYREASGTVAQLRTLQPEEDSRTVLFLKNWDAGQAKISAAAKDADKLAANIEGELAVVNTEGEVPQLSPDLQKNIEALDLSLAGVTTSKLPAVLLTEARKAQAVCEVGLGFGKLNALFAQKQYYRAKGILDPMSNQASLVGKNAVAVMAKLQQNVATSIGEFERLRQEAKIQTDANKPAEALAAYEKAYAVIPDPAVGEQITQLKEKLPKKK